MAKIKHSGLGRGLGALLPSTVEVSDKGLVFNTDNPNEPAAVQSNPTATPEIKIDEITRNPYQPRKEFDEEELEDLKNSILEFGIIQPITVRRTLNGFELISGERRLRAAKLAGLTTVPAHIISVKSDLDMMAMALIENVQRNDLNPIEIANGYNRLIEECGLTQEEVAGKVGKDRSTVTNSLRLLRLPEKIQDSLRLKEISGGHARAILALDDPKLMLMAWRETVDNGLSVRKTEELVRKLILGYHQDEKKSEPKPQQKKLPPDVAAAVADVESRLRSKFSTRIRLIPKDENAGKIELEYYNSDDLERLLEILEK